MMATVAAAAAPTAVQNHQRWKIDGRSGDGVRTSNAGLAGGGVAGLAGTVGGGAKASAENAGGPPF